MAEVNLGVKTGNITITDLFRRNGAAGNVNSSFCLVISQLIDNVTSGQDAATLNYIKTKFGLTIP